MGETSKPIITLVGVKQAKPGFTFLHEGPTETCRQCKYLKVCMENLEMGRIYRVIGLRKKILPCKVHENGVQVVEAMEADIKAAIEARLAFQAAIITFNAQDCINIDCINYEKCSPNGLINGDKCKILEVDEPIKCPLGRSLVVSVLRRQRTFS